MDGAVVIPVEIAGKTRNLLFDTGFVEDSELKLTDIE